LLPMDECAMVFPHLGAFREPAVLPLILAALPAG
jgi:hypothetical protein